MPPRPTRGAAVALLLCGLGLAACAPTIQIHGYIPSEADISRIKPGVDTTASVEKVLGLPSGNGLVKDQAWYYVESTFENYTYHAPQVIDRRILAVTYNDKGVVTGIARYGIKDGRVVNLATETTVTGGQQLGVLEQLFGNLLHLDASQFQQQ